MIDDRLEQHQQIKHPTQAMLQTPILVPIQESMLEQIYAIEQICQDTPWTKGNFMDAIRTGYHAQAVVEMSASENVTVIGYYVALKGVDEVHLLNINIAPAYQKQGFGWLLLEYLKLWSLSEQMQYIWLEVREHNERALSVYKKFGFQQVGQRKNYYAMKNGEREDAILMSLNLC